MADAARASGRARDVVAIGSKNRAKTEGAKLAFKRFLPKAEFRSSDVTTRVRVQPMNLDETVEGARRRAELALVEHGARFGVGVEAGLVGLGSGFFLNLQIGAVVDDSGHLSFGCSSGFPIPKTLASKLEDNSHELDHYTRELTGAEKVPEEHGVVYRLSGGRLSRLQMTEQCVSMALIPWLNPKLYGLAKRRGSRP